jgi:peptidoglycan/LPS O-acetylase OafA/YrhL
MGLRRAPFGRKQAPDQRPRLVVTHCRDHGHPASRGSTCSLEAPPEHPGISHQEMPLDTPSRIPSLDGLRAISIFCVLLAHLSGTHLFLRCDAFELYGNFGVRMFFVISGYLITTILLKEQQSTGTISLRQFYVRRAYRILPAAYAYMFVSIALNWPALRWGNIATAITYTSSYYPAGNWSLGHMWSLSVEEQFYLLWPLTLLVFFRLRLRIVAALIAAGPFLRTLLWLLWGHRGIEHPFPAVMDALAAGCALAMVQPQLRRYDRWILSRWFLVVPALTALTPLLQLLSSRAYQLVGLTLMHLGIAMTVQHTVRMRYRALNLRPMVWLGVVSYSLYLWQQPFLNRASSAWWAVFPLNLALALLCATASYRLVEKPFLALRERGSKGIRTMPARVTNTSEEFVACAGTPPSAA